MIFLLPAQVAAQPNYTVNPFTMGRFDVSWTRTEGLHVLVDRVPVIRQSTLYLVKKGWTGVLFDQSKADWKITRRAEGATLTAENADVAVRYELQLTRPDSVTVALYYRLKREIPAELEYAMGYVNANVLRGAAVAGDTKLARVPLVGLVGSQEQRRVGPPFTQLAFETPLGPLSLHYSGTAPRPVLFDARKEALGWAEAAPTFWMGIGSPAQPVTAAQGEKSAILSLSLPPKTVAVRQDAFLPLPAKAPLLIPRPKKVALGNAPLRLTPNTPIVLGGPGTEPARALLSEALRARLGWVPKLTYATSAIAAPDKPEGYALAVDKNGVRLAGHDSAGTLWAVQTLIQLLDRDTEGPVLQSATITDWPTLAFRGVHLFHGQNALPFHTKLIDRIYSRFKLNHIVVQCEQLQWDSDPAVAPSWGGTKAAVRQEIAYAKTRGITLVPLVQSYGHMEWLFNKPQNRAFAEDPELPYAVNINNPAALDYLGKLVTEADALFGAPAFHAGLDEVTMRGRFPYKSAPRSFSDLFVTNAKYWHDFHQKRGKQMWMWADMALHPSEVAPCFGTAPSAAEAKAVRAGLPKDIVLFDWQYGAHQSFPSLKLLKDAGFSKVVASTWFNPGNIQGFAKAAAEAGAWGGLQTTWCGYESKEEVLSGPERRQFSAMVLAAEHFWNGGAATPSYDPAEVFTRAWADPVHVQEPPRPGTLLALPTTTAWEERPKSLPTRETRLADGVLYGFTPSATVLQGRLSGQNAPLSVRLTPPTGTKETHLILVASHRAQQGTLVGTVNGVALIYGENIAALEDPTPLADRDAIVLWQEGGVFLRRLTVVGDNPLVLESASGEVAPILLAATALH